MRASAFAVALVLGGILAGASSSSPTPSVWLTRASPVVASGSGFTAGKKLTVSYKAGTVRRHLTVRANARGAFRVVFAGLTFKRCNGATLTAGAAELLVQPCTSAGTRPSLAAGRLGIVRGWAFVPREQVVVTGRLSGMPSSTAEGTITGTRSRTR